MERLHLFHWKAAESGPLIAILKAGGFVVDYPGERLSGGWKALGERGYCAIVIDLTRMPSHGRYAGITIRTHRSTCHLPIVYVDGDPAKAVLIRESVPNAVFTTRAKLVAVLKKVKPIANATPLKAVTFSYTGRTTAQKMGIRENSQVGIMNPPPNYERILGDLPEGVSFQENPKAALPMTILFATDPESLFTGLAGVKSKIWVVWPKTRSKKAVDSGITQALIRDAARGFHLVDYKICSVNETWSGIAFTRKKN